MASVFGKKIDLRAGRFSIGSAAAHLAFAGHRPVILGHRHRFDHLCVEVVGKNAVEMQVIERCIVCMRLSYRVDYELDEILQLTLIFPLSISGEPNLGTPLCGARSQ